MIQWKRHSVSQPEQRLVSTTRVLNQICDTTDRTLWTRERCSGLKLERKEVIYPVSWEHYYRYLHPWFSEHVLNATKSSVIAHVWNYKCKQY